MMVIINVKLMRSNDDTKVTVEVAQFTVGGGGNEKAILTARERETFPHSGSKSHV